MEKQDGKLVKNKPALIAGILPALFFVLYGNELLQTLSGYLLGASGINIEFNYLFAVAVYTIPDQMQDFSAYLVLLSPVLISLILIQIASLFLQKVPLGFYRYTFMIFQLIMLGYILLYLLFGTISVLLKLKWDTDIQKFIEFIGLDYPVNLLIVFLMIFIIGLFINFNAKRVSVFINK